jgi:hypothetical protein
VSKEHRRSLVAFALVGLACAVVLASGLRSNAVQGILGHRAVHPAAAFVVPGSVLARSAQPRVTPRHVRTHAPVRAAAAPTTVVPERAEPAAASTRHRALGHPRSPGRGHAYGRTHAPGHGLARGHTEPGHHGPHRHGHRHGHRHDPHGPHGHDHP